MIAPPVDLAALVAEAVPAVVDTWGPSLRHGHGLDTVAGYLVLLTMRDGVRLPIPYTAEESAAGGSFVILSRHVGPCSYGAALEDAQRHRGPGSWARVVMVYTCGCCEL